MVARIKQLLDWQQLSPTQFADRIGVGRPVMSHILSERNKPSLEVARSIKAAFPEISFDWLLNGIGDMLVIPAPRASASASQPIGEIAPTVAIPTAAAAPIATSPTPVAEAIAVVTPLPVSPAGQALPAYQQPQSSAPAPTRFTPAGKNTASKATPSSAELAAERFVVRGVGQALPTAGQPLPDVTPPPPATVPPAIVPPVPAVAASMPAAPAAVEVPSPAATAVLAAIKPPSVAAEAVAMAQALAGGLSESSKDIRRIVIFYSDGSFADYKPES